MARWIFGFNSLNSDSYLGRFIFLYGALIKTNSTTTVATHFLPCAVYLVHQEPTSNDYNLSITSLLSFWHYLRSVLFSISFPPTTNDLLIYRRMHVSLFYALITILLAPLAFLYFYFSMCFAHTVNFKRMVLAKCEKTEWQCRRSWARFIRRNQIYWLLNISYIEFI